MEMLTGTVTKTNGNGFRIAEQEGWLNISKFAKPAPDMPAAGQRVRISLDESGYVRAIVPAPVVPDGGINREGAGSGSEPRRLRLR